MRERRSIWSPFSFYIASFKENHNASESSSKRKCKFTKITIEPKINACNNFIVLRAINSPLFAAKKFYYYINSNKVF